ncbi:MAG: hypothetical protein AAFR38_13370 [Planctomycetota bacterium]
MLREGIADDLSTSSLPSAARSPAAVAQLASLMDGLVRFGFDLATTDADYDRWRGQHGYRIVTLDGFERSQGVSFEEMREVISTLRDLPDESTPEDAYARLRAFSREQHAGARSTAQLALGAPIAASFGRMTRTESARLRLVGDGLTFEDWHSSDAYTSWSWYVPERSRDQILVDRGEVFVGLIGTLVRQEGRKPFVTMFHVYWDPSTGRWWHQCQSQHAPDISSLGFGVSF